MADKRRLSIACAAGSLRAMIARLLLLAAVLLAVPAHATSVARMPPHDPLLACFVLDEFVTAIGKGSLPQTGLASDTALIDDANGRLLGAEREALVVRLGELNSKRDRTPIRLGRVMPMGGDGTTAVYLVELVRDAWVLQRWEEDAMLMPQPVADPHWEDVRSYWLATFWSNRLQTFRETMELWPLLRQSNPPSACPNLPKA